MSDDIVTRLRQSNGHGCECGAWYYAVCECDKAHWSGMLDEEAANEIERLRKENQRLRQFADDLETAAEIDRVHLMSRIIGMEQEVRGE